MFDNLEPAMAGDKRVLSLLFARLTPLQKRIEEVIALIGLSDHFCHPGRFALMGRSSVVWKSVCC